MAGRSESTLKNYGHHLAKLALHFGCVPTALDTDQVDDYLYHVKQKHPSVSDSFFKFTIYGLRFVYRMEGLKDKRLELPSLKNEKKLPVVLSQAEVRRILESP
ncbi:MAG: hypothetical protein U5L96_09400 [Owenweeksia sp.]|nr:hypothetical protein [Owenweeksia sp.]